MDTPSYAPFVFPEPLLRGTLVEKKARFVALVDLQGTVERCFLPVTVSIGDFHLPGLPCLLQKNPPGRKTAYTVKAISVDEGASWLGVDLNFSNRLVEHFAQEGALEPLLGKYSSLKREQRLGTSRLDFKVDDLWVEVKTPVDTLHKLYGPSVTLRKKDAELVRPAGEGTGKSSEEVERRQVLNPGRMENQVKDLMEALKAGDRAALLTVHQYLPDTRRPYRQTNKKQTIKETLEEAYSLGLESWKLDLEFLPTEVRFGALKASRITR